MSGVRKHGRGMRPAGGDKIKNGQMDVRENIVVPDGPVVRENTSVVQRQRQRRFLSELYQRFGSPLERDRTVVITVCLLERCMKV